MTRLRRFISFRKSAVDLLTFMMSQVRGQLQIINPGDCLWRSIVLLSASEAAPYFSAETFASVSYWIKCHNKPSTDTFSRVKRHSSLFPAPQHLLLKIIYFKFSQWKANINNITWAIKFKRYSLAILGLNSFLMDRKYFGKDIWLNDMLFGWEQQESGISWHGTQWQGARDSSLLDSRAPEEPFWALQREEVCLIDASLPGYLVHWVQ